jgi:hypothetical protein
LQRSRGVVLLPSGREGNLQSALQREGARMSQAIIVWEW